MDNNIVPTVEFGFDLTQFGGDYDYGRNNYSTISIPVDLIQEASQGRETADDENWEDSSSLLAWIARICCTARPRKTKNKPKRILIARR